ncbi:hypothetical protein TNCV_4742411 [Trichonephila clavipes]|nr:hypothetical protein TNCV_4742411 [Trichonephila clavipes]
MILMKTRVLEGSEENRSICLSARKKIIRFSNLVQSRHPETMTHRKGLSLDEIANLLRDLSVKESEGGEL